MKPIDSTIRNRLGILLVAALLASAAGYSTGRVVRWSPSAEIARVAQADSLHEETASEPGSPSAASSPAERAAYVARMRDKLIRMWRTSPSIRDWELRRETHRLLAKLTADELAELYQAQDWGTLGEMWLRQAYLTEWAIKDGPAAVTRSVKKGEADNNACSAFATWAFHDPDAALVWLRDVQLPPPLANSKDSIRLHFLSAFAQVDFQRVSEEFAYMSPKGRTMMLSSLTRQGASDPEFAAKVSELSKQYMDPKGALVVERSLLSNMAQSDPAAANDRIAKMDLPEADTAELYLAVLRGQSSNQPAKAFAGWLARNPSVENLPGNLVPVMDQSFWSDEGRKEMTGWLDSLPAGPARDAFYEHATRLVAANGGFEKAATYADAISDPAKRVSAIKTLRNMWTGRNPEAAGAWLGRLSQEDRAALGL